MRYPADPMAMFKVMNKVKPFDSTEQLRLNLPVRENEAGKTEQASAVNQQLLPAYKKLYRAYVRLMENGRDQITYLGGDCDPVDVMEANDPSLIDARAAIAAAEAANAPGAK